MINVALHGGTLENGDVRGDGRGHYIALSLKEPEDGSIVTMFFDDVSQARTIAGRLSSLADELENKNGGEE